MSDIAEIELSMDHAKELIAKKDSALKLSVNREFKKLVFEGYFEQEAVRLTHALSDHAMIPHREQIIADLDAIGRFKQYMTNIVQFGKMAETDLKEAQEALAEMHNEDEG